MECFLQLRKMNLLLCKIIWYLYSMKNNNKCMIICAESDLYSFDNLSHRKFGIIDEKETGESSSKCISKRNPVFNSKCNFDSFLYKNFVFYDKNIKILYADNKTEFYFEKLLNLIEFTIDQKYGNEIKEIQNSLEIKLKELQIECLKFGYFKKDLNHVPADYIKIENLYKNIVSSLIEELIKINKEYIRYLNIDTHENAKLLFLFNLCISMLLKEIHNNYTLVIESNKCEYDKQKSARRSDLETLKHDRNILIESIIDVNPDKIVSEYSIISDKFIDIYLVDVTLSIEDVDLYIRLIETDIEKTAELYETHEKVNSSLSTSPDDVEFKKGVLLSFWQSYPDFISIEIQIPN